MGLLAAIDNLSYSFGSIRSMVFHVLDNHTAKSCAEAGSLGLKLYDTQNSHWNISFQAGLRFWKRVILKYMLKENIMKFVEWIIRIHGGISKIGT